MVAKNYLHPPKNYLRPPKRDLSILKVYGKNLTCVGKYKYTRQTKVTDTYELMFFPFMKFASVCLTQSNLSVV